MDRHGNSSLQRRFVLFLTLIGIAGILSACNQPQPAPVSSSTVSNTRSTAVAGQTPAASTPGGRQLNKKLPEGGNVSDKYQVSANGTHAVFIADADTNDVDELYSVPLAGGPVVKLNSALEERQKVSQFSISPDGKYVVFLVAGPANSALFSVPTAGGKPVMLTLPLFDNYLIKSITISPDSSHVVYYTRFQSDEGVEIYSTPITGGKPDRLSQPASQNSPLVTWGDYKLSADSKWVIFSEDKRLYRAPLAGGAPTPLTETGVMVEHFQISPDSSFIVYTTTGSFMAPPVLYRIPAGGGTAIKLGSSFSDGPRNEGSFTISPDGKYLVFTAVSNGQSQELFSIAFASPGTVVMLNHPLVSPEAIVSYTISPNSQYVAYTATWGQQQINYDLYSVPVGGGTPVRLNQVKAQNFPRHVNRYAFSPNSNRILYICSCEDGFTNLYSVVPTGPDSSAVRINTPKYKDSGGTQTFAISDDSSRVIYVEYEQIPTYFYSGREWWIMSAPITGGGHARLAGGPVARSFVISPDNKQIVYQYSKRTAGSNLDTWNLYVNRIAPE